MCYLNSNDVGENGFSWHDLLVEANGVVFDLLVFGILLSVYESLRAKKANIDRFTEEIDDYRGWDEREASYRIAGLLRRLNKEKKYSIDLSNCYLVKAYLSNLNLSNSNFWYCS